VAQWLVERFDLTIEDARDNHNQALLDACSTGNMKLAWWVTVTIGLC
jgi:hypothetical protein